MPLYMFLWAFASGADAFIVKLNAFWTNSRLGGALLANGNLDFYTG